MGAVQKKREKERLVNLSLECFVTYKEREREREEGYKRITVFVKIFDRKKGRTSRKIRKRTNFITVEHIYEDGIR